MLCRRGRSDNQHDLALHLALEPKRKLSQGTAAHLFVHLGHFPADRSLAIRSELGQSGKRVRDPAGRLEGDHGLGRVQNPLHLPGAFGQEALEPPTVSGQAGSNQGHRNDRGAGQDFNFNSPVDAGPDQPVAGIGDGRHARIRDQGDLVSPFHPLDQFHGPGSLIALVIRDQSRLGPDLELFEQAAGPARVLAGDVIGHHQCFANPLADVVHVADRGRANGQAAGHQAASASMRP